MTRPSARFAIITSLSADYRFPGVFPASYRLPYYPYRDYKSNFRGEYPGSYPNRFAELPMSLRAAGRLSMLRIDLAGRSSHSIRPHISSSMRGFS